MFEDFEKVKPREGKRPSVLFLENNICIDARECGNKLRFVRRSCAPNSIVKVVTCRSFLILFLVFFE
jgi:hypothetical protein